MSTTYAMRTAPYRDNTTLGAGEFHHLSTPGSDDVGNLRSGLGSEIVCGWTMPDDPLLEDWPTGDYTVNFTVTTGAAFFMPVELARTNSRIGLKLDPNVFSGCNNYESFSQTISIALGLGSYSVTFTAQEWGHGERSDQLRVALCFGDGTASTVLSKCEVVAPWSAAAATSWVLQTSTPVTLDQGFAAVPSAWAYFPWEFPPYMIQGPDAATRRLRMLMGLGQ